MTRHNSRPSPPATRRDLDVAYFALFALLLLVLLEGYALLLVLHRLGG